MSIYDTPDDPRRVAGPGELPDDPDYDGPIHDRDPDADRDRLIEDGRFGEVQHGNQFQEQGCFYRGSLISDCLAASALAAHSDFCLAHGLPQPKSPNQPKSDEQ